MPALHPDERTAEPDPADEAAPPPGVLGFATDIVGLFRADLDRASMFFAFDLHRFEDVRDNAAAILARLENGSMPCDAPWPSERIALFQAGPTTANCPESAMGVGEVVDDHVSAHTMGASVAATAATGNSPAAASNSAKPRPPRPSVKSSRKAASRSK